MKINRLYQSTQAFMAATIKHRVLMAVDLGTIKIGIAFSDRSHLIAEPYQIYFRKNIRSDLTFIIDLCKRFTVGGLVIGYPFGCIGEKYEQSINFIKSFTNKLLKNNDFISLNIPCIFCDENFSSMIAGNILSDIDRSRSRRSRADDNIAAAVMLRDFLRLLNR